MKKVDEQPFFVFIFSFCTRMCASLHTCAESWVKHIPFMAISRMIRLSQIFTSSEKHSCILFKKIERLSVWTSSIITWKYKKKPHSTGTTSTIALIVLTISLFVFARSLNSIALIEKLQEIIRRSTNVQQTKEHISMLLSSSQPQNCCESAYVRGAENILAW